MIQKFAENKKIITVCIVVLTVLIFVVLVQSILQRRAYLNAHSDCMEDAITRDMEHSTPWEYCYRKLNEAGYPQGMQN